MKTYVASGRSVEDAIQAGLNHLNCSLADVDIEVQEVGSKGLFGMFGKLASVKLSVRSDEDADQLSVVDLLKGEPQKPVREKTIIKPAQVKPAQVKPAQAKPEQIKPIPVISEQPAQESVPAQRAPRVDFAARKPAPIKTERSAEKPAMDRPARPVSPRRRPPREESEVQLSPMPTEAKNVEDMTPIERTAYEFLHELTRKMDVPVSIIVKEEQGTLRAAMTGDSMGILIGRRGDTLDALQYLTSLQINKSHGDYIRVMLDTENYREKREDALRQLASRMASRARKTSGRVVLEPMNPYERRVLHSSLQNHPYVTTHSEGEEPNRRVIITLK